MPMLGRVGDARALVGRYFSDAAFRSTADPLLEHLAALHPVLDLGAMWIVSGLDEITAITSGDALATYPAAEDVHLPLARSARLSRRFELTLPMRHGEDHRRLRALAQPDFSRSGVAAMTELVETCVRRRIDEAVAGGRLEVVADLAEPLPVDLALSIMGIPETDRAMLEDWATRAKTSFLASAASGPPALSDDELDRFDAYVRGLVSASDPVGDGILARLGRAREAGRLDEEELLAYAMLLMVNGLDTLTAAISIAVAQLLGADGRIAGGSMSRATAAAHFEECLRYYSPVRFSARLVTRDIDVGGQHLDEGDVVTLFFAAANRDPRHFERPGEFDPHRPRGRHLAFGHGAHQCLGRHLANLAGVVVLERITELGDRLQLDGPVDELAWSTSLLYNTLDVLPLRSVPRELAAIPGRGTSATTAERLAGVVAAGGPRPVRESDRSRSWVEAARVALEELPDGSPGRTDLAGGLRRAASRILSHDECDEIVPLSTSAHDHMVAAAVSRLTQVMDPAMREELGSRAPDHEPRGWLEEPALARPLEEWVTLVERWPVLTHAIGTTLAQWRAAVVEMLSRLGADRDEIITGLLDGRDPGRLVGVRLDAGDRHGDGRAVALLRFESGHGLVYKPRDVRSTQVVMDIVRLLNSSNLAPALATRGVLARAGYGYEERLELAALSQPDGAARFYERLGAWTRVMQLLGARDMWADNLLAVDDQPHLVDLECILSPSLEPPPLLSPLRRRLYTRREATVLASAIPLAARPPTVTCPTRDVGCLSHADDPMDRGGGALPIGPFRPFDGRGPVDPWEHAEDVVAGYRAAQAALEALADDLARPGGPLHDVEDLPSRFIWRDTFSYVSLLHESVRPEALVSWSAREDFLSRAVGGAVTASAGVRWRMDPAALARAEFAALARYDIPHLQTRAGRRSIFASHGVEIDDQFPTSGLAGALERVADLGAFDLEDHVSVLRAAIDAARGERAGTRRTRTRRTASGPSPDEAVAAAREIGHRLDVSRRSPTNGGEGWLAVVRDLATGVVDVHVASDDLVGGALGPALLLAELDAIGDESECGRLAVEVIDELIEATMSPAGTTRDRRVLGPPGAAGLVGDAALVAVGDRVATATGDPDLSTRLDVVRDRVLGAAWAGVHHGDVATLAPLTGLLLAWPTAGEDALGLAALLAAMSGLLVTHLSQNRPLAEPVPGLEAIVSVGRDAVTSALALLASRAPGLLADPDEVTAALTQLAPGAESRGGRLAALALAAGGIVTARVTAPPGARAAPDAGTLVALAEEHQLRARILGDEASASEAGRCLADLLERRRATGRFLDGRVADDDRCLSAIDGLAAVGRALLRVAEPSLPLAGVVL